MATLALPRTNGCLVCGRDNPHGLHLRLYVDEATGIVHTDVTPSQHHAGFVDVVHGGFLATVADEAMVWAATWRGRRFCLAGELTIRFRKPARVGEALRFEANVESARSRLIMTTFQCSDAAGMVLANGAAKYVPMSAAEHGRVIQAFLDDDQSRSAAATLRGGS